MWFFHNNHRGDDYKGNDPKAYVKIPSEVLLLHTFSMGKAMDSFLKDQ